MIMKKVLMFLLVPFIFQQCTNELGEMESVIGSNSEYSSSISENDPGISEIPNNSFKATYLNPFDNNTRVTERIENSVELNFNEGISSKTFNDATSAFWVGDFDFNGGNYEISVQADKQVTILIDNQYVVKGIGRKNSRTRFTVFRSLDGVHRILVFYNMDKSQIADKILEYYTGLNTEEDATENSKSMKPTRIYSGSKDDSSIAEKILPHIAVQWRKH